MPNLGNTSHGGRPAGRAGDPHTLTRHAVINLDSETEQADFAGRRRGTKCC